MYYYYTTTNSIPKILSHLTISSDSEFTDNIHRLHDSYKISELKPFKSLNRIREDIKGKDNVVFNVVVHLPKDFKDIPENVPRTSLDKS